jgi:hypothetical protein
MPRLPRVFRSRAFLAVSAATLIVLVLGAGVYLRIRGTAEAAEAGGEATSDPA